MTSQGSKKGLVNQYELIDQKLEFITDRVLRIEKKIDTDFATKNEVLLIEQRLLAEIEINKRDIEANSDAIKEINNTMKRLNWIVIVAVVGSILTAVIGLP